MGPEGILRARRPSPATVKFVLMILEALWDEASNVPFPASLGVGQGHTGMRLLPTSCRLDCALHPTFSSVSFQGEDSLRPLGDLSDKAQCCSPDYGHEVSDLSWVMSG